MILDQIDIFIIKKFWDSVDKKEGEITTWTISKEFKWDDSPSINCSNIKKRNFYSNKCNFIEYRIKKMVDEELIIKIKEGKKIKYALDGCRVMIKKSKLPNGIKNCIFIKDKSDKWMIIQID